MWCALSVAKMHFTIFARILSMRSVGMCPRKLASSDCIDRKQIALREGALSGDAARGNALKTP